VFNRNRSESEKNSPLKENRLINFTHSKWNTIRQVIDSLNLTVRNVRYDGSYQLTDDDYKIKMQYKLLERSKKFSKSKLKQNKFTDIAPLAFAAIRHKFNVKTDD
jgi:hypothetical protein